MRSQRGTYILSKVNLNQVNKYERFEKFCIVHKGIYRNVHGCHQIYWKKKQASISLSLCSHVQRHLGDLCKRSTGSVGHPPPPPLNGQWPWLTRHHNQRHHNKGKYGLSSMSLQLVKEASISTSRCMSSSHYAYVPANISDTLGSASWVSKDA